MHNLSISSPSNTGTPCFSEKIVPVFRVGVMRVDNGRERTKGGFPMSRLENCADEEQFKMMGRRLREFPLIYSKSPMKTRVLLNSSK